MTPCNARGVGRVSSSRRLRVADALQRIRHRPPPRYRLALGIEHRGGQRVIRSELGQRVKAEPSRLDREPLPSG